MSTDRETTRIVRSWMDEGVTELPDRVLDAVLDAVPATPQRRAKWSAWRTPVMNKIVGYGLAAAAVVAVVFIGAQLLGSPGGLGSQSSPSPEPSLSPSPSAGGLPQGSHLLVTGETDDPAVSHPPLTVTIPAPDWYGDVGGGILVKNEHYEPPNGSGMIIFGQREYIVYGDACSWETTIPDAPATSVDEFIAALSSQGSRDASEPVDITLGGYAGTSITLEVADDVDFDECDPGYGGNWDCGGDGMTPCGYTDGREGITTVYALDFDGLIVAWTTIHYAGTPAEDVAELEAIVQSASFGD